MRAESVAVVVVTHNRADLLVGMLDGLATQTHAPDAVIVVDNGSTDHIEHRHDDRLAHDDRRRGRRNHCADGRHADNGACRRGG